MRLSFQFRGQRFAIYWLVLDNGECPARDFLQRLKQNNIASHRSLESIIKRHADHGVIRNKRKSRMIEGQTKLGEFKSRQGDRLVFFYLSGGRTVLTHGFHKGAKATLEFDRAETWRDHYLGEAGDA